MKELTVFTPTYNRRHLLKRAYESLINQTDSSFVWLVVDDGSTDNTKELVDEWIKEGKIDIRYVYCENGGKMRAHNIGARLADTPLFLCLDSDDYLCATAVLDIINLWNRIKERDDFESLCGIVAHKGKSETELLSSVEFPDLEKSTLYNLYLSGFKGETTLIFRTDVIKEYPFPEIDGEKYVPEDYIYDKIDQKYALIIMNKIITICELVSCGYTDSVKKLKRDNKVAWYLYYEQRARITPASKLKCKYLAYYVVYARRTKNSVFKNRQIGLFQLLIGFAGAVILKLSGKE